MRSRPPEGDGRGDPSRPRRGRARAHRWSRRCPRAASAVHPATRRPGRLPPSRRRPSVGAVDAGEISRGAVASQEHGPSARASVGTAASPNHIRSLASGPSACRDGTAGRPDREARRRSCTEVPRRKDGAGRRARGSPWAPSGAPGAATQGIGLARIVLFPGACLAGRAREERARSARTLREEER